jgi:hypothetical protein
MRRKFGVVSGPSCRRKHNGSSFIIIVIILLHYHTRTIINGIIHRLTMKFLGALSAFVLAATGVPSCLSFQTSTTNRWGLTSRYNQRATGVGSRLASLATSAKTPGSAQLDTPWEELGFEFRPTNSHVSITYKDGEWGEPELVKVSISCAVLWRI